MNILHVSGYAIRGGCEKNCLHFISGSPQHQHTVIVLSTAGPMTQEWREAGAVVHHLNILQENLFSFSKNLRAFLKGQSFDIAVAWSTIRLPLQLHALDAVTSKVKVYLGNPVGANYKPVKDIILSKFYSHKCSVELMACSKYTSESYVKSSYYSRYPTRVSLNPIIIPPSKPAEAPPAPVLQVGMVARLDRIKDQATVIRAFSKLDAKAIPFQLHIVGNGDKMSFLKLLADKLKVSDRVVFHGDVKDVYEKLRSWHIFTYATTPEEGLGSAVAEAMANGLPCIISDLPMLRELAPGNQVLWFPAMHASELAKQVVTLSSDTKLRHELGQRAYDHAATHFTVQRFINDYLNK